MLKSNGALASLCEIVPERYPMTRCGNQNLDPFPHSSSVPGFTHWPWSKPSAGPSRVTSVERVGGDYSSGCESPPSAHSSMSSAKALSTASLSSTAELSDDCAPAHNPLTVMVGVPESTAGWTSEESNPTC